MKHLSLKEMPLSERPYEKCEEFGVQSLSDAELLAVIIKTGSKGERAVELASRVLNAPETDSGLYGLNHFTMDELMQIKGIGKVKAIQLLCITEIAKRMHKQQKGKSPCLSSPSMIADYYMEDMRYLDTEQVILLLLDTKCNRIKDFVIFKGTVNETIMEPREILINALRYHAVQIVLLHNHPSGDVTPSKADRTLTVRLKEACDVVGIPLIDHIILGDNAYWSFLEQGSL